MILGITLGFWTGGLSASFGNLRLADEATQFEHRRSKQNRFHANFESG